MRDGRVRVKHPMKLNRWLRGGFHLSVSRDQSMHVFHGYIYASESNRNVPVNNTSYLIMVLGAQDAQLLMRKLLG